MLSIERARKRAIGAALKRKNGKRGGKKRENKRKRKKEKEVKRGRNSAFSAFLFFATESLGYGKLILQSGASRGLL